MRLLLSFSLTLIATLTGLAEDEITLKNKDLFIGKVVALKDGFIELNSPHSETPLKIINKDLIQLNFSETDTGELPKNSQILNLRNGDYLPGEIISLNETHLGFKTWFAGPLEVPRNLIESVYFGVTPQRTISRGPKNINDWEQDNDGGWTIRDGVLTSSKASFVGKNLALTQNFIFRADIGWKTTPSLRIYLCSDQLKPNEKKVGDCYMITINSSGIDVKRVMPEDGSGPNYRTLITHSTNLQSAGENPSRLELQVNRKTRTLQLYLNGSKLEQGIDPAEPPSGTHVLFQSLNSTRGNTLIRELIIQEWDSSHQTQLRRIEPREAHDNDTLSVGDGDRFSGKIISYDAEQPTPLFTVESPLSPTPIQIPLEHCSVMYFAKDDPSPTSEGQYQLDLRTGGQLTLNGIRLGEKELTATHPWLGDLQVSRRIMQSISKGR